MKAKLSLLWKHQATLNYFLSSQGYSGTSRAHAEICLSPSGFLLVRSHSDSYNEGSIDMKENPNV